MGCRALPHVSVMAQALGARATSPALLNVSRRWKEGAGGVARTPRTRAHLSRMHDTRRRLSRMSRMRGKRCIGAADAAHARHDATRLTPVLLVSHVSLAPSPRL